MADPEEDAQELRAALEAILPHFQAGASRAIAVLTPGSVPMPGSDRLMPEITSDTLILAIVRPASTAAFAALFAAAIEDIAEAEDVSRSDKGAVQQTTHRNRKFSDTD